MEKEDANKESLRALSQAIMEAVTNDAKVMAMLRDLKERGIVDASTLLGLALRIGEITEVAGMTFKQEEIEERLVKEEAALTEALGSTEVPAIVAPVHELIDGRELSAKEVAFQSWSAERFDERAWLKKMGLIF